MVGREDIQRSVTSKNEDLFDITFDPEDEECLSKSNQNISDKYGRCLLSHLRRMVESKKTILRKSNQ